MKIEGEFKVGVREIGKERKISNIGMLGFLEEIGAEHSSLVIYQTLKKRGLLWIGNLKF